MWIAKPLQTKAADGSWNVRYEPTKKESWLRTRHRVVFRRKDGKNGASLPFEFAEATESDATFKDRLQDALRDCVRGAGFDVQAHLPGACSHRPYRAGCFHAQFWFAMKNQQFG